MKSSLILTFIFALLIYGNLHSQAVHAESLKVRSITLEWDPVVDAKSYELEIKELSLNKITQKNIPESKWKGQLPMSEYQYRIRSVDDRNAFGAWTEWESFLLKLPWPKIIEPGKDQKIFTGTQQEKQTINFRWKNIDAADTYYFELRDQNKNVLKSEFTKATSLSIEVPVGYHYTWVVASLAANDPAPKIENLNQSFQVQGGALEPPVINRLMTNPYNSVVWTTIKNAEVYSVQLEKRDSIGNWKTIKKEENWPNTSLPMIPEFGLGDFRLTLKSVSDRFQDSRLTVFDFTRSENHDQQIAKSIAANDKGLSSLLNNKTFYFGAGLINANYQFLFQDAYSSGSSVAYDVYLGASTPLPSLDLSLNLKWETYIFNNSGTNISPIYLTGVFERLISFYGETTVGGGLFFRENPMVASGTGSTQGGLIEAVRTAGPEFTISKKGVWNSRFSWQLNLAVDFNIIAIHTPNNENLDPSFGYALNGKLYFAKIAQAPVYLGMYLMGDEIRYINLSTDTNPLNGKPCPAGTMSYSNLSGTGIFIGSELTF